MVGGAQKARVIQLVGCGSYRHRILRPFVEKTPIDFYDKNVRHDTVRINSNEMVELLVYFPKDPKDPKKYTGKYPYHCHLVEHEDMGMMLHFEVQE